MSKLVRTWKGRICTTCALLALALVVVLLIHGRAQAAPYTDPWWTNTSPSPESALPDIAGLAMCALSLWRPLGPRLRQLLNI